MAWHDDAGMAWVNMSDGGYAWRVEHADMRSAAAAFDEASGASSFVLTHGCVSDAAAAGGGGGATTRVEFRCDGGVAACRWARTLDERIKRREAEAV